MLPVIGRSVSRAGRAVRKLFSLTGYRDPGRGTWMRILSGGGSLWLDDLQVNEATVAKNWAVFSCVTLIAGDISKMPARVMELDKRTQIWRETELQPVLRKPNQYQTRQQFLFCWVASQLFSGNTFALKQRDERGRITALYILDPCRVTPLVAPDGSVFYQLGSDNLSGIQEAVTVPASEIIHDRMYATHHPLIGMSPIYACGTAATQGSAIAENSAKFFQNMSRPSGVLVAPGAISPETALTLKTKWDENFKGGNIGKIAVLGDGLKYEAMTITATDSQLIEQLKFTGEMICATFHVPPYKLSLGQMPTVNNTAALNQQYYDQCLQFLIEKIELCLDVGLEIEPPYETWLDTSALLRMDPAERYRAHGQAIKDGWLAPNEARRFEDLPPVPGGDTPYLQVQNYSLAALAKRDAKDAPSDGSAPSTDGKAMASRLDHIELSLEELLGQRLERGSDSLRGRYRTKRGPE